MPQISALGPDEEKCGLFPCIALHESTHADYANRKFPTLCSGKDDGLIIDINLPGEKDEMECEAFNADLPCVEELAKGMHAWKGCPAGCPDYVEMELDAVKKRIKTHCKGTRIQELGATILPREGE
jgi:hypothetical protein